MKLAFSTNAFTRFSPNEALRAIAEAGFAGVEILADVSHAYPEVIAAAFTRATLKAIEANKLIVSNVNVNCSFGYWKDALAELYWWLIRVASAAGRRRVP